jgi:type III pantothenate kinase
MDIGNARIKWARSQDGVLSDHGEALHLGNPEQALDSFVQAITGEVTRMVATNVAGKTIEARLDEIAGHRWSIRPEWIVSVADQLGVTCGYSEPRRLGADRWVTVLAAYARANGAACVIDAGSAVTFDVVDAGGQHLGGLIMAGPRLVATALSRETSDIGQTMISEAAPRGLALMGRSTDAAVAHGAMLSVAAAADRALKEVALELQEEPLVLLTGGHALSLLPWLECTVQFREHLVLEGLALVAGDR